MLPKTTENLTGINIKRQPSKTYKIDVENGVIEGLTDGKDAMEQAIYKALNTERFIDIIYSWNYGAEMSGLMGRSHAYVYSELRIRIKEALMRDDRVKNVHSFEFSSHKNTVSTTFIVDTTEGTIKAKKEVTV